MPTPSTASVVAFIAIMSTVQITLVAANWKSSEPATRNRRIAVHAGALVAIVAGSLGLIRVIDTTFFPPVGAYFFGCTFAAIALAFSGWGRRLATGLAPASLLLLQGFRVPLEILLHRLHTEGVVPVQMTWAGQNLDIIAGVVCTIAGLVVWKTGSRKVAVVGHVVGLVFLLNVMRIAMTSIPSSPARMFDDPLLLPFIPPFILIMPFAVASALFIHLVGLRSQTSGELT